MTAALSDRALLEAWSGSRDRPANERADALLAADASEPPLQWSLARRHAALAALHAARWGPLVDAVAECPRCQEEVEVAFDLAAVEARPATPPLCVPTGGEDVGFRLPTRADLRTAVGAADPRRALVEVCLTAPATKLDEEAVDAIAAAMERADPFGALRLKLTCPACEHDWEEALDLGQFLASEAQEDARSIAAEVHELALAYGWSEPEILALPAERRRLYLELVAE